MRTTNYIYRLYCTSCEDFKIHDRIYIDELSNPKRKEEDFKNTKTYVSYCQSCNTKHDEDIILNIDNSKIEQQQKRYLRARAKQTTEMFNHYTGGLIKSLLEPFNGINSTEIIESDAGVIEQERINREKAKVAEIEAKKEFNTFKGIGRNDICRCGSNLKFKKCCFTKITGSKFCY